MLFCAGWCNFVVKRCEIPLFFCVRVYGVAGKARRGGEFSGPNC